jgi:hypothetical protein
MTDYTPTTDTVRNMFSYDGRVDTQNPNFVAAFDRWLAAHDKEVLEMAALGVEQMLPWYAEEIFPPFTADETNVSRDRVSAQVARHLIALIAEGVREIAAAIRGEGERDATL